MYPYIDSIYQYIPQPRTLVYLLSFDISNSYTVDYLLNNSTSRRRGLNISDLPTICGKYKSCDSWSKAIGAKMYTRANSNTHASLYVVITVRSLLMWCIFTWGKRTWCKNYSFKVYRTLMDKVWWLKYCDRRWKQIVIVENKIYRQVYVSYSRGKFAIQFWSHLTAGEPTGRGKWLQIVMVVYIIHTKCIYYMMLVFTH